MAEETARERMVNNLYLQLLLILNDKDLAGSLSREFSGMELLMRMNMRLIAATCLFMRLQTTEADAFKQTWAAYANTKGMKRDAVQRDRFHFDLIRYERAINLYRGVQM